MRCSSQAVLMGVNIFDRWFLGLSDLSLSKIEQTGGCPCTTSSCLLKYIWNNNNIRDPCRSFLKAIHDNQQKHPKINHVYYKIIINQLKPAQLGSLLWATAMRSITHGYWVLGDPRLEACYPRQTAWCSLQTCFRHQICLQTLVHQYGVCKKLRSSSSSYCQTLRVKPSFCINQC